MCNSLTKTATGRVHATCQHSYRCRRYPGAFPDTHFNFAHAATEAELVPKIRDARARIAFYASTPQYLAAFQHLGLGDLATECKVLSQAQRWEELPRHISDEVLDKFAVIGTYDQIARKLCDRFGHLVTNIEFSIAVKSEADQHTLARLAREVQAHEATAARHAILGKVA